MFCTIHRYKNWFEDLLPKWCHLLCEPCTALIECASCVFLEGSLRGPIFSLEIFSLKICISSVLASTAAPCEWAAKKVPQAATRSPGLQRQRRRRGAVYTRGSGFPWRCSPPPECSRVPTYVEYSHRPPERLCIMNGSGAVCSDSSSSFFSPLFLILLFPLAQKSGWCDQRTWKKSERCVQLITSFLQFQSLWYCLLQIWQARADALMSKTCDDARWLYVLSALKLLSSSLPTSTSEQVTTTWLQRLLLKTNISRLDLIDHASTWVRDASPRERQETTSHMALGLRPFSSFSHLPRCMTFRCVNNGIRCDIRSKLCE